MAGHNYMLRQNGKRFYKALYVTFKLVPDIKKNTVYLSSYSRSNEGHVSIQTNSMLRIYTSNIDERIILRLTGQISWNFWGRIPIFLYNYSVKVAKIRHAFVKLQQIVFAKVSLCLQINGKKTLSFSFQLNLSLIKCTKQHFNYF